MLPDGNEAIKKTFTPEFRNRLDAVISFDSLNDSIIKHVVDKFLTELQAQLDEKRIQIDVDDKAREWLSEKGFDRQMGARPMGRIIQEYLKKPLAEQILFGKLAENGGNVISLLSEKMNYI